MNGTTLSRRNLIKLSAALLAGAPSVLRYSQTHAEAALPPLESSRRPLGRAIQSGLPIRELPATSAKLIRNLKLNEIISITGQLSSESSPSTYNKIWFKTTDGWIHSAFVQPVDQVTNQPLAQVDPKGFWGEITFPFAEARTAPDPDAQLRYRFYYGSIFLVINVMAGKDGLLWYQIRDDYGGDRFFVQAHQVRPVQPDELTAISPDVPASDKHIEVDLVRQVTTAFEGSKQVFTARVATGTAFRAADGTVRNMRTIPGDHRVYKKFASQHMTGGLTTDNSYYDLPGIGWVSYFTASGIAFHSTYWHNDYGRPRSHGCVNMLPEDAKWIFRWTLPLVSYDERQTWSGKPAEGTLVKVF
jgi:lipoprotein-anchoring transpeptidase ErfK/SrfK